jgi:hypothetical protein
MQLAAGCPSRSSSFAANAHTPVDVVHVPVAQSAGIVAGSWFKQS